MDIKEYREEWQKDSKIDNTKIDLESLKISELHSKYLNFLSAERLRYRKLLEEKAKLEQKLTDYYEGVIDGKDIGREPFQLKLTTNSQITKRVQADKEYIACNLKISLVEESTLFLKEVLGSINQRSFNIKNYIEWCKFMGGQL